MRPWIRSIAPAAALLLGAAVTSHGAERGLPGIGAAGDAGERARLERGRYLTRMGNCAGCHTEPGGEPFAGGRALDTEFGRFRVPNITPDRQTGIGGWSADDLWNALHRGQRPDGAALYPACPYPNYTLVARADVDAIHAYLQSIPPVRRATAGHALDFPYRLRALAQQWQWLYFEPGRVRGADATWSRGSATATPATASAVALVL